LVISDKPHSDQELFEFIPWQKECEISDLQKADIGIMPLPDNNWAKGKCGFKALQYMALGIPPVASEVGVNSSIIDNEINGFLVSTHEQWKNALTQLIESKDLREKMGKAARNKVEEYYSAEANKETYLKLFS
jgi:glycosyltransferase involved in cell wall biosynthesis